MIGVCFSRNGWTRHDKEISCRLKDRVIRSFVKCGHGSRDSEINIDGLPDYHMNESADVEETEFFSVLLVHDISMRFILQYTEF